MYEWGKPDDLMRHSAFNPAREKKSAPRLMLLNPVEHLLICRNLSILNIDILI